MVSQLRGKSGLSSTCSDSGCYRRDDGVSAHASRVGLIGCRNRVILVHCDKEILSDDKMRPRQRERQRRARRIAFSDTHVTDNSNRASRDSSSFGDRCLSCEYNRRHNYRK